MSSDNVTLKDPSLPQASAQTGGAPQAANGTPKRTLLIAFLVLLLFTGLAVIGYRWMRDDALATLVEFSGQPERDTAQNLLQWRTARVGDAFNVGDGARTPEASVAHFRLRGGAKLRLQATSQIRFQRPSAKGALRVDVDLGEADVLSGERALAFTTEFGELTLESGSSIKLTRNAARLNVSVDLGRIQINDKVFTPGNKVELEFGGILVDAPAVKPEASVEPAEATPLDAATPEATPPELNPGDGVASVDLVVKPGESFVVHDPEPPTAVGFRVAEVCNGPARLSAGGQTTEAVNQANLRFARGQHSYEVRCLDQPGVVVAQGTLRVLNDAGTRKLPTFAPTANVTTDGRRYTVMYQHHLPTVTVSWPTAPEAASYTLTLGERSIQTTAPRYTFGALGRGTYRAVFKAATEPARQSRVTTIEVVLDTQAPAARVSTPPLFAEGESVTIAGQALPGWDVSVNGQPLAVDAEQNFSMELKGRGTIPITFSHPSQGTHYYLRRPAASP